MIPRTRLASLLLPPSPAQAAPLSTSTTTSSGNIASPAVLPAILSTSASPLQWRSADKPIKGSVNACSKSAASLSSSSYFPSSIQNACPRSNSEGGVILVSPFLSRGRRNVGYYSVGLSSPSRRKGKTASPEFVEMRDGDDDDYDDWEDEDGEGQEDGSPMPFVDMRQWLRNKPAGFGVGKSYDTSIEDRLLEEIELRRKAQLANVKKLENVVMGGGRTKKQQTRTSDAKVVEVSPSVARVRIRGLPRKKNIIRDLNLAFKGFPSLVKISPAVVGNKKTRDPVCKGFAFIDFASDEAADKFVLKYSDQSVLFGRVQKEIICDVVARLHSHSSDSEKFCQNELTDYQESCTEQNLNVLTRDLEVDSDKSYVSVAIEDQLSSQAAGASKVFSDENFLTINEDSSLRIGKKAVESGVSRQQGKHQMVLKKSVKTKQERTPKLSMPGSAARLKVKERAILLGVLSKYGEEAVPEES